MGRRALERANRTESEPDEAGSYESIGASAELDSLIFDGSTYGTTTAAGSAEEQDFLGLPGLLDAEQVRTLLQKRQSEQLDAREAAERARKEAERATAERAQLHGDTPPPPGGSSGSGLAADEIPQLRRELNARVSVVAGRTGRPHGSIHNEVRKACGGPPTALCNAQQLRDRIAYLRDW